MGKNTWQRQKQPSNNIKKKKVVDGGKEKNTEKDENLKCMALPDEQQVQVMRKNNERTEQTATRSSVLHTLLWF